MKFLIMVSLLFSTVAYSQTPEQKEQMRNRWNQMDEGQKKDFKAKRERFKNLPPEEKAKLKKKWQEKTPQEREKIKEKLKSMTPEEKKQLHEKMKKMTPEEKAELFKKLSN